MNFKVGDPVIWKGTIGEEMTGVVIQCYEGGITIRWQNQRELYYRAMPKNYATGQEHIKLDLITKRNSKLEELGI